MAKILFQNLHPEPLSTHVEATRKKGLGPSLEEQGSSLFLTNGYLLHVCGFRV